MEEIEFIFQASMLDVEKLVPQVSRALEKRLQLRQQMLPQLVRRAANRKKEKLEDRCNEAAREFLEEHAKRLKEQELQFCFSTEEMITVIGALEDLDQDAVSFDAIECIMETDEIFFVVYQGHGVVLQKKDLTLGTLDEFRTFVNGRIKPIIALDEE